MKDFFVGMIVVVIAFAVFATEPPQTLQVISSKSPARLGETVPITLQLTNHSDVPISGTVLVRRSRDSNATIWWTRPPAIAVDVGPRQVVTVETAIQITELLTPTRLRMLAQWLPATPGARSASANWWIELRR